MRKLFEHSLVEQVDLKCETTEKGRIYITPKGHRLKSVTTILGEKTDQCWLWEWRKRVGIEEANRISTQATRRGTAIHGMAERYVLNEENYLQTNRFDYIDAFESIKSILDNHIGTVYGIEIPLYSLPLKTAGKADLIAKFDNVLSVIDYKTSRKHKTESQIKNYFIQSTVYSMMFERLYRVSVPRIVIIMAVEDEPNALLFVKNRDWYVKEALEIFNEGKMV